MRLLDRYLGRQLFVTSLFAIVVLSAVLVLGNVFKQLLEQVVNKNAPIALILSFVQYVIPFSLTFTLPWGFLTAVLLVFGRMSAENELTAMRTSGLSIPRICLPVAVFAVIFTSICLWINLDVAPRAQDSMKTAIFNIATSNPLSFFGDDRIINELPNSKIYVEKVEPGVPGKPGEDGEQGDKLHNVQIYSVDDSGALVSVLFAREGRLTLAKKPARTDKDGKTIEEQFKIVLYYKEARLEMRDEKYPDDIARWQPGVTIESGSFEIDLGALYEAKKKSKGVSTLGLDQLLKSERPEAKLELQKRYSNAMATLAFALVAIPLAVTAQRKETSVGFAISVAIGLIYYAGFFFIGLVPRSWHPEYLVWLPNVLFFTIGGYRFWNLSRR